MVGYTADQAGPWVSRDEAVAGAPAGPVAGAWGLPPERTLLMEAIETRLDRVIGGGMTASGVGRLDETSFEFRTTGIVGALFRGKAFKTAVEAIRQVDWTARTSRLTLHLDGDVEVPLQGPAAAEILTAFRAMGLGPGGREPGAGLHEVHLTCRATVVRGPVHFKGHLAFGGGGLFWESAGSVEQLVGVDGIALGLDDIGAVGVDSGELKLTARDGTEHRLMLEDAVRVRAAVREVLLAQVDASLPLPVHHAEAIVRFTAMFRALDATVLQVGVAEILPDGRLALTPFKGSPLSVSPVEIQRLAYGPADALETGSLVVPAESGELLTVSPRGGLAPLEDLFALSRELPLIDVVPPAGHALLRSAIGEIGSVRSESPLEDELSLVPATLVHLPEALGVVLPDHVDWAPEPGTRIRLLLGLGRNVLQVTGRYVGTEKRYREAELPGWPRSRRDARVLELAILDDEAVVRLPSRRETFRVVASEEAHLREMDFRPRRGLRPVGPRLEGRLVNLSIGGCALLLRQPWPAGTVFSYHLAVEDDGEDVEMELEVIHCSAVREDDEQWHKHGMRFRDLSERDERALAQEIRRREVASAG